MANLTFNDKTINKKKLCGISPFYVLIATVSGLVGLMIVIYFINFKRPLARYAIVIDAGSTQTRSTLYEINYDNYTLRQQLDPILLSQLSCGGEKANHSGEQMSTPLNELIKFTKLDSCVNGGPASDIFYQNEANRLIKKCVMRFEQNVRTGYYNNFNTFRDDNEVNDSSMTTTTTTTEVNRKELSDSIIQLYLGATAGFRALHVLDKRIANERITIIQNAALDVNSVKRSGIYIQNKFVGILPGKDEALFSWLSVNYLTGLLRAEPTMSAKNDLPQFIRDIFINDNEKDDNSLIGMLELGGASAQIAYQVDWPDKSKPVENGFIDSNLEMQSIDLFHSKHNVATRSDLCLGMSQAVNRAKYVLLKDYFDLSSTMNLALTQTIELEHPCMQNESDEFLNKLSLDRLIATPCLSPSNYDQRWSQFIDNIEDGIKYRGTGNVDKCAVLLDKLINPQKTKAYFSLYAIQPKLAPPKYTSFVTVSGYNHALRVLDLPMSHELPAQVIKDSLGGGGVDYSQLVRESQKFCATPASALASTYPRVQLAYAKVICLQLVYVRKLITDYYQFEPQSTWKNIKFLLFDKQQSKNNNQSDDIGWTLGLLLNATNEQFVEHQQYWTQQFENNGIIYHHGTKLAFAVRSSLLLVIAAIMIAVCLTALAIIAIKRRDKANVNISRQNLQTYLVPSSPLRPLTPDGSVTMRHL